MENQMQIKALILKQILEQLDQKITILHDDITSLKEARDNEVKNTSGDMFETGREMMVIELEKNEIHLNKTLMLKKELLHIDPSKKLSRVEFGSVVFTTLGNYFMTVALTKVEINNQIFHPISMASPIGQALQNRKVNESIQFQGKEVIITEIL